MGCLARRDTKKLRVKLIHMFQKASPASTHFSGCARTRVIEGVDIPALCRNLGNGVYAITKKPPKGLGVFGSGKAATHADDGNWIYRCLHIHALPWRRLQDSRPLR